LKLPFSLFLALRYLKPKRTFLSVITLISVLGVMLGVTVLILVISVMTGFDRELRQKVIDFDAHILVTTETTLTNWRELTEKIRATPRVVATAPEAPVAGGPRAAAGPSAGEAVAEAHGLTGTDEAGSGGDD
jgi:lipoprotein-releasing system permease protein